MVRGWTRGAEGGQLRLWLNVEMTMVVLNCVFAIGLTTAVGGLHGGRRNEDVPTVSSHK